jgi:hypothetical protein
MIKDAGLYWGARRVSEGIVATAGIAEPDA